MSSDLRKELNRVKHQIQILEQTEGFCLLTPFQQRFIKNSLFLEVRQQRYERLGYPYRTTDEIHSRWFCHASVLALEEGLINGYQSPNENIPNSFFSDNLVRINSVQHLNRFLRKAGFPSVVNIGEEGKNYGRRNHNHTCLCLGTNQDGEIVLWEKEGYCYPFQITTTKRIYHDYPKTYYSARPLRTTKTVHIIDDLEEPGFLQKILDFFFS